MSKLRFDDVQVLGEGPQIRNVIKQKYKSVKDFYEIHKDSMSMTYNGFRMCFSMNHINTDTFKCIITKLLNVDYKSLFIPVEKQITTYIHSIYDNIREYGEEDDQLTFDYLLDWCKKENMMVETAMMYRAKARNYYRTNMMKLCVEAYEYAIKLMPKSEINMLVLFHCELADDLFRENMLEKANKRYSHIENMIKLHKPNLDNTTLYSYYYWRGITFMYADKTARAIDFFTTAAEYAPRNFQKASSISNLGLTLKRNKQYSEALEYYHAALEYPDESNVLTQGHIYNNMAMAYKAIKNYTFAIEFVKRALEISEKQNDITTKLIFTSTYVEIQIEMGNTEAYKLYLDVLLSTKGKQLQNKPDILKDIRSFIDFIGNIRCLNELIDVIIVLKKASNSIEYNEGLINCIGLSTMKIRELSNEGV